jgi:hypothetical protein
MRLLRSAPGKLEHAHGEFAKESGNQAKTAQVGAIEAAEAQLKQPASNRERFG